MLMNVLMGTCTMIKKFVMEIHLLSLSLTHCYFSHTHCVAGPSSAAPGETVPAPVGVERNKREEEGEEAQSEDDMHKRILYELATSTWDESPVITCKRDTPTSNRGWDSDQDVIIISTSPSVSDTEGIILRHERVQDNRVTCSTGGSRGGKGERRNEIGGESEGSVVHEKRRKHSKRSKTKSHKHRRSYLSDSGSCSEEREGRRSKSRERSNSQSLTPKYYKDSKRKYDKERKHRTSTHHKEGKSDRRSRDESCDHGSRSRYHGYSSRDHSRSSRDYKGKKRHEKRSKKGKRSHEKDKQSRRKSRDQSHDKKKAYMISDCSTSGDDRDVFSDDQIKRELEDINDDLLNMKKRLLKHCLHRERATLLKSALHKELGGIDTPLDTPTKEGVAGTSSIDELEDELMRIERDLEASRNEVAVVNERLKEDSEK